MSSGQGMLLNTLLCTGQPPFPSSNVNSANAEKCWPRDMVASFMIFILSVQGVLQVGKMESEGACDEPCFLSFLS